MSDVDDFLAHYGVLGMHWGTRKAEVATLKKPKGTSADRHNARKASRAVAQRHKEAIASARWDILKDAAAKVGTGQLIVGSILTGTWAPSAQIMNAAGYSMGKSIATTFFTGPFGTMAAINTQAHKRVDSA